jgi:hypothetical protein
MVKNNVPYMTGGPEKFKEYVRRYKEIFGERTGTGGRVAE